MSIRAISLCIDEHQFERSGNLQGMQGSGKIATGEAVEAISDQEVLIPIDGHVLVLTGLKVNGQINGREFHSITPTSAFGIIGWLFQTDLRGSYLDEPIIGK